MLKNISSAAPIAGSSAQSRPGIATRPASSAINGTKLPGAPTRVSTPCMMHMET